MIIRICEEFEKDVALGLLDLLNNALNAINGFDHNENRHTDVELNSVSIRLFIIYRMKFLDLFFLHSSRCGWKFNIFLATSKVSIKNK